MNAQSLADIIGQSRITALNAPLGHATGLPGQIYTEPSIWDLERKTLFKKIGSPPVLPATFLKSGMCFRSRPPVGNWCLSVARTIKFAASTIFACIAARGW